MPAEFADSNVLLYLTSSDPIKADPAEHLLERGLTVSVQVLNEVANVSRRKFSRSWAEIASFLDRITPLLDVYPLTQTMHRDALRLIERYKIGWWDSLIVSAALEADCHTLYSEEMHHGLVIDGRLRITNPFI